VILLNCFRSFIQVVVDMACLAVKIGNTSVAAAVVRGKRVGRVFRVATATRDIDVAVQSLRKALQGAGDVEGSAIASVVPRLTPIWATALRQILGAGPLVVRTTLNLGVALRYPKPKTLGADRLANAAGAFARYGAPAIVMDFGTATVFDAIAPDGAFVGGVIVPGLPLMTEYLHSRTALLPRVAPAGACPAVGRSTRSAIRIGMQVGYRGLIRAIVAHLRSGKGMRQARLCATGGYARQALRGMALRHTRAPDLTLFGIARIWELNRSEHA
jgi:type III pantothenate kinase